MPEMNDPKTITRLRADLTEDLSNKGIDPITRDGKFAGVLISVGEQDAATAGRLLTFLQANEQAAVQELVEFALSEK
jgi:hypothetical protein